MSESVAGLVVTAAGAYVAAGLLFALPFVLWGAGRLNPAARAGTTGFRLLIVPGVVVFWPLLAIRWASTVRSEP